MPKPNKNEKEDDFISRCIPIVIEEGTTDDPDQAAAICHSMWEEEHEKGKASSWFQIKNLTDISEIWIYDEVGIWGVNAKDFIKELNGIKNKKIDMHINSPGGDVFDGAAIYNAIKRHAAKVTTYIDGLAASIASVIALAGEKVIMAQNALYMVHNPWGLVLGNANDMRAQADVLDKVRDTMLGAYKTKSGRDEDEIKALLDAETWMSANEASEFGFVDEISEEMDLAACATFVPKMLKAGYKHIPEAINPKQSPSVKDAEKALRDVGFSVKESKSILAKGFPGDLRDVDHKEITAVVAPLRDVEAKPKKKDRTADLLTRAELVAPTRN